MDVKAEALFPPQRGGIEIPLTQVWQSLSSDLAKSFEVGYTELRTKDRMYYYDQSRSIFTPSTCISDGQVACPKSCRTTRVICTSRSHTGDCIANDALQRLIGTPTSEQWQRCFKCKRFLELLRDCNDMTLVEWRFAITLHS
jgi:hypothetical protein